MPPPIYNRPAHVVLLFIFCLLSVIGLKVQYPPCAPGYYVCDNSNPLDFYFNQGTCEGNTCDQCSPGEYQPENNFNGNKCTKCPENTFCKDSGCISCQKCAVGTFAPVGSIYCHTHSPTPAPTSVPTPLPSFLGLFFWGSFF